MLERNVFRSVQIDIEEELGERERDTHANENSKLMVIYIYIYRSSDRSYGYVKYEVKLDVNYAKNTR